MPNDTVITIDSNERPDLAGTKDSIQKLLNDGLTVQVIAARLNIDPIRVLAVSDENRTAQYQTANNGQRLHARITQLDELIDLSYWQCKAEPIPPNVYAYSALVDLSRGVMSDIDGRRDHAQIAEDLLKQVLEPMLGELLVGMTQKLAGAKTDLGHSIPSEHHATVGHQLDDILRGLGASMQDQLVGAKAALERVLNDAQAEQAPKPKRQPKMLTK